MKKIIDDTWIRVEDTPPVEGKYYRIKMGDVQDGREEHGQAQINDDGKVGFFNMKAGVRMNYAEWYQEITYPKEN